MSRACRFCLLFLLGLLACRADAAQSGDFTYTVAGNTVTITGVSTAAAEAVTIPPLIEGRTVTRIGVEAFRNCAGITSLSIPAGVMAIGESAFAGCSSLSAITVVAGNPFFSISGGVLFNIDDNILVWYPPQRTGAYDVPEGVTAIAGSAFRDCSGLDAVTLPSSVLSVGRSAFEGSGLLRVNVGGGVEDIGARAFAGCAALESVVIPPSVALLAAEAFSGCPLLRKVTFTGDSPSLASDIFTGASAGLTVFFFDGAFGFSIPTWAGCPSVNMGPATSVKSWLVRNHQSHDAPLTADPDGDGVPLLMAYALALDPNRNLAGALPRPVISGGSLAMDYYSGTAGITYQVQTSADLKDWTPDGMLLSAPDAAGMRRATFSGGAGRRFMRLMISR